jgi:hypothetical protein
LSQAVDCPEGHLHPKIDGKPTLDVFVGRLKEEGVNGRLRGSAKSEIERISFGINGMGFQGRQLGKDYS